MNLEMAESLIAVLIAVIGLALMVRYSPKPMTQCWQIRHLPAKWFRRARVYRRRKTDKPE